MSFDTSHLSSHGIGPGSEPAPVIGHSRQGPATVVVVSESAMTNERCHTRNRKFRSHTSGHRYLSTFAILSLLLFVVSSFAQENKCTLKLADLPASPELFGFHLGMTTEEANARVPQMKFKRVDAFGLSKTSINPDFDPHIDKSNLAGVRTVSLEFLDGRLISLWFGYDSTFKWTTVPQFITGISQSFHLPDAWRPGKIRGQQLNCADFQMIVTTIGEGPSFRIIDQNAAETIVARREAKEEQDSAAEETETEIVADEKARVYYLAGCTPAVQIRHEDRIEFKSKEQAENAGYKLAGICY